MKIIWYINCIDKIMILILYNDDIMFALFNNSICDVSNTIIFITGVVLIKIPMYFHSH